MTDHLTINADELHVSSSRVHRITGDQDAGTTTIVLKSGTTYIVPFGGAYVWGHDVPTVSLHDGVEIDAARARERAVEIAAEEWRANGRQIGGA